MNETLILVVKGQTFNYDIWFIRFGDGQEVVFPLVVGNDSWKWILAYLAVEFGEIVGDHNALGFLLEFILNPRLQAFEVHHST